MRREIEAALDSQRNIVPLMLAGFDFGTPATASQLTGKLAALKKYNGLEIPKVRFFSSEMERLRNRFLNVRVDAVLHPASDSAQQAAKEQRNKATIVRGEAPHQPSLSPEVRTQEDVEAKHRAEEEARQMVAEKERRNAATEQRRKKEAEPKHQEDEAQRRREIEAARKAEAERKRADVERPAREREGAEKYLAELQSALEQYRFRDVRFLTDQINPASFNVPQIKKALGLLRRKRLYADLEHAASLFSMVGRDEPVIQRQWCNSLLDQGRVLQALATLNFMSQKYSDDPVEGPEIRGLIGRASSCLLRMAIPKA
jgi:hypothetical protein